MEQTLLEKQEDWELEREIERAEYEASIKHKERSLREELQIEMYANMDEERMNMEDEIRNGIGNIQLRRFEIRRSIKIVY